MTLEIPVPDSALSCTPWHEDSSALKCLFATGEWTVTNLYGATYTSPGRDETVYWPGGREMPLLTITHAGVQNPIPPIPVRMAIEVTSEGCEIFTFDGISTFKFCPEQEEVRVRWASLAHDKKYNNVILAIAVDGSRVELRYKIK